MTIDIFVLKGDLNGENRSGAFLFLSGIYGNLMLMEFCTFGRAKETNIKLKEDLNH